MTCFTRLKDAKKTMQMIILTSWSFSGSLVFCTTGFPENEHCSNFDNFPLKFLLKLAHFGLLPTRSSFHQISWVQLRIECTYFTTFPQVKTGGIRISDYFEKGRDRNAVFLHAFRILEQGDLAMHEDVCRKIHVLTQHVINIM